MHTFDLSIYLKYLKDIFEIRYFLKNEQEKGNQSYQLHSTTWN